MKVPGFGPIPAKILLVGEAPGESEVQQGKPFVGQSGQELTKILNEAGILRTECRVTNVCKYRPPGNKMNLWWAERKKDRVGKVEFRGEYFDPRVIEGIAELKEEIATVRPNIIVPLGNLPLWTLTGNKAITKWRSSLLHSLPEYGDVKVVPTIHPAAILRKWDWRYLAVHDLRRVARWSGDASFPQITERFTLRPSYSSARGTLANLMRLVKAGPTRLAVDIETRARHIACLGIAWSRHDAICLPFMCLERPDGYWSPEEEIEIILCLRELLTHPNAECVGQNWQYDYQYIAKYWGFEVNLVLDTMSEHHVQFPGLPKGLDFQSSLYRDIHVYWKDESKEWTKGQPEDTLWLYNCRDCVATYEDDEVLLKLRRGREDNLRPFEIQQALSLPMARASARGIRLDLEKRRSTAFVIQEDIKKAEEFIDYILGAPLNVKSPKQMHQLFYTEFGVKKILNRKTHKPTLDAEALEKIAKSDLLLAPLCEMIEHVRSLYNSFSVCTQPLDLDQRFRCQYTIPGTETFRFSSSKDPFGFGGNWQNVTSGDESDSEFPLPNLRKFFIPDPHHTIGEVDMPQADARIVAWEAEDRALIELFEDPTRHLHMENAELIFGVRPKSKDEKNYYFAKQAVHLTNYGGTPQVLAATLGITVHEASNWQTRYFQAHKPIRKWHERIQAQLFAKRYVENKFGYRRFYFDRIEGLLKEALAWIPQSTVAVCTNLGILACFADSTLNSLGTKFLGQVHDSAVYEWPTYRHGPIIRRILDLSTIEVPYDHPLILRPEAKWSEVSWGDCKGESYALENKETEAHNGSGRAQPRLRQEGGDTAVSGAGV